MDSESILTSPKPIGLFGKLVAYIELAHPIPMFTSILDGFLFILIASGNFSPWPQLVALLVAKVAITAFVDTFNDYCDIDLDTTAKPRRPIPSQRVSPKESLWVSGFWLLLIIAILPTVFNFASFFIALGILLIGSSYNLFL